MTEKYRLFLLSKMIVEKFYDFQEGFYIDKEQDFELRVIADMEKFNKEYISIEHQREREKYRYYYTLKWDERNDVVPYSDHIYFVLTVELLKKLFIIRLYKMLIKWEGEYYAFDFDMIISELEKMYIIPELQMNHCNPTIDFEKCLENRIIIRKQGR